MNRAARQIEVVTTFRQSLFFRPEPVGFNQTCTYRPCEKVKREFMIHISLTHLEIAMIPLTIVDFRDIQAPSNERQFRQAPRTHKIESARFF